MLNMTEDIYPFQTNSRVFTTPQIYLIFKRVSVKPERLLSNHATPFMKEVEFSLSNLSQFSIKHKQGAEAPCTVKF